MAMEQKAKAKKGTMHWRRMKNEQRKIIKIFPNKAHTEPPMVNQ